MVGISRMRGLHFTSVNPGSSLRFNIPWSTHQPLSSPIPVDLGRGPSHHVEVSYTVSNCQFRSPGHWQVQFCSLTPVAGSIFGPLFQTHIFEREFKNEILRSALLDIQLTLFCVCGVDSFLPELEHL